MKSLQKKWISFGLAVSILVGGVPVSAAEVNGEKESNPHLIINQVYGGGGKGETPVGNSFVELYNPTAEEVNLKGYSLEYDGQTLELSDAAIAAGTSWLVVGAREATTDEFLSYDLPEADQKWDVTIHNKNYTVELKNGETTVDTATADETIDEIKVSKQKSLRRVDYSDTDTNADWAVIVWEKASVTVDDAYLAQYAPRNAKGEYGRVHTAEEEPVYTPAVTSNQKVKGVKNGNTVLDMQLFARYNSGALSAEGGSLEIVEYNSANGYAYAVSGIKGRVISVKVDGVTAGDTVAELTGTEYDVKTLVETAEGGNGFVYGDVTSVAISPDGKKLAAAIQHADYEKAGKIAVFDCSPDGSLTSPKLYEAGVQPDMVVFADGNTVLTADEGEPRNGYGAGTVDPRGTVTVLNLTEGSSTQVGFEGFTSEGLTARNILLGVVDGVTLDPSVDLEPEYIAVTSDGTRAYISLQEANAVAVLDIPSKKITEIYSVGFEDYSKVPVDLVEDGGYKASVYENLLGARMPDGISLYEKNGRTWLLTANEGDSREWGDYCNEAKTKEFTGSNIRIIDRTKCAGLPDGKSVMFGGRGFSVFEVTEAGLKEVYDSGKDFEALTAEALPDYFNCSNDDKQADSRSGKKGPEPENLTVGEIKGRTYAFVAVERIGGIFAYDITEPQNSKCVNYINSREFSADIEGDVSPEGICFIPAEAGKKAVVLAACEVSGTLAAYELSPETTHIYGNGVITKAPTCSAAGIRTYTCKICGETKTESIAKTAHTYVTSITRAAVGKNGSIVKKCSVCGETAGSTAIYAPKTITLSKTKYVYNGTARKPSVTVKDSRGKKLKNGTDYTVSYSSGRKNVGVYTVTIKFKGNYSGTGKKTFTIIPKSTSISKLAGKTKGFTVKWKKLTSQITGYQLQYSTSSKFTAKTTKTVTISKSRTTSKVVSRLKAKKKYYVRIRTYKTVKTNGRSGKFYGNWSKAGTVTTKK